jgi:hypothetical protein
VKRRRPVLTPFVTFLLLTGLGILGSTGLARYAQRSFDRPDPDAVAAPQKAEVDETQKLFIASRTGGSDLLFKIAFASLGALLGLRFSEKTSVLIGSHSHFAAASFLLCSIYNAFLYQESVAHVLEGPLLAMYGPELRYPVLCQFWFLFAAVVLLAASLFRPSRRAVAAVVVLVLSAGCSALAQDPASPLSACAGQWGQSRSVELDTTAARDLATLAERIARRREVDLVALSETDRCSFVASLADHVRFTAISDGAPSEKSGLGAAVKALLRQAVESTESPNFSAGEFLDRLLGLAQIWREPSAVLDIDSGTRTLFVSVTDPVRPQTSTWKGYTRFLLRIPPGTYQLSAAEDGILVTRRTITVKDGDRTPISIPDKP